ncbi:peptidoglycan-binding domain-containing protein [Actinomadura rubrisoli]|uniref:Peptidoglycan-binding protein n=1 Tax=Actinomadura rubrisoli TaxID=2530368 RepID=A0A4R5BRE2_9ACTN|nr:peptidoglycan-binding domain-containing protein [Actinomadura rubrisoli]TDD88023.1 peptidoglycan-binding protein [Actinomadura rubrisoli]
MTVVSHAAIGLAAIALAAGTGLGAAGAAHADGPTDPVVTRAIEAAPWVELKVGDRGYRVAAVRCFLTQWGFFNGCAPGTPGGDEYTADFAEAVKRYQRARDLPDTGVIDAGTWVVIRTDFGVLKLNDRRTNQIKGAQYALKVLLPRPGLKVDGKYGPDTAKAVRDFQAKKGIGVDGDFGPLTFKAAFDSKAEARGIPGR